MKTGSIRFHSKTNIKVVDSFMKLIDNENVTSEELVYSCPMGLQLTARINTNYLQLKTQYHQRKSHDLEEWRDYCAWIKSLPFAQDLIINVKGTEK